MEKLLLFLFLICGPPMWAQATFSNQSNENVSLIYEGKTLYVEANAAVVWPEIPMGEFIAYVYKKAKIDSVDLIKKIGFVRFKNEKSLVIFSDKTQAMPVYIHNSRECKILIEYGKNAVFIAANSTSLLPDYYILPDFISTILWTEYCDDECGDKIQSSKLEFKLTKNGLEAEL
jgi:hypothetical protein